MKFCSCIPSKPRLTDSHLPLGRIVLRKTLLQPKSETSAHLRHLCICIGFWCEVLYLWHELAVSSLSVHSRPLPSKYHYETYEGLEMLPGSISMKFHMFFLWEDGADKRLIWNPLSKSSAWADGPSSRNVCIYFFLWQPLRSLPRVTECRAHGEKRASWCIPQSRVWSSWRILCLKLQLLNRLNSETNRQNALCMRRILQSAWL